MSNELLQVMQALGLNSLQDLYASRDPFYISQPLPNQFTTTQLNTVYLNEFNFNDGYNHGTQTSTAGDTISDALAKTPVDQRDAKYGLPHGTENLSKIVSGGVEAGVYF